jgi:hypothetical protein
LKKTQNDHKEKSRESYVNKENGDTVSTKAHVLSLQVGLKLAADFQNPYFSLSFSVDHVLQAIKIHSRCFGIMRSHGNFAFNLVVKLFVELDYVFLSLKLYK